ncbi:hypothetical protein [Aureimonas glaciei]|uniref:Uncharacterized protein n=1 Tax=Aureimonas glaciei TaxID=1776957 RepID=A0A917DEY7_9HYPH|nr:hypothetical protein [Aureimonas glaciei]GGD31535.1 hypothetical protein GCM10011335_38210 [Aureimonas glaciei]
MIKSYTHCFRAKLCWDLMELETAGDQPGVYVYHFDNGTCLNVEGEKPVIRSLLSASRFDSSETETKTHGHIRNGRGEVTEVISFRLARKLAVKKMRAQIEKLRPRIAA